MESGNPSVRDRRRLIFMLNYTGRKSLRTTLPFGTRQRYSRWYAGRRSDTTYSHSLSLVNVALMASYTDFNALSNCANTESFVKFRLAIVVRSSHALTNLKDQ